MCKEKTDNMSGIYLGTDPVTETMNGVEVTAQKLGDSYYSLSLAAENGYFCVSCTSGMEKDTLYSYLESLYKANSSAADAAVG